MPTWENEGEDDDNDDEQGYIIMRDNFDNYV
jgi:hypothetical protein